MDIAKKIISMKKTKRYIYIVAALFVLVSCFFLLFTEQYENYQIIDVSLQKVDLVIKDSDLILDKAHRNYYLLHFEVEYCNSKYKFLHTPNPKLIKGSVEQIKTAYILDSLKNKINDKFFSFKMGNIFDVTDHEQKYFQYCSSFASFNELIQQINNKKRYGAHNNIKNDCLLYIESNQNLPKKIVFHFSTYSIENSVNNNPYILNLEKDKYDDKPTFYDW